MNRMCMLPGTLEVESIDPSPPEYVFCGMVVVMNHAASDSVQARTVPPLSQQMIVPGACTSMKLHLAENLMKTSELPIFAVICRSMVMKPAQKLCHCGKPIV